MAAALAEARPIVAEAIFFSVLLFVDTLVPSCSLTRLVFLVIDALYSIDIDDLPSFDNDEEYLR